MMLWEEQCEGKCEEEYCTSEIEIEVKNEGRDLKRWLKFLRWIGIKIEPKILNNRESSIKKEYGEPTDFASTNWNGFSAAFEEIGRTSFNIGRIIKYDTWLIGIDNQSAFWQREKISNPIIVTQILPFDEAYTGYPAVHLL